VGTLDESPYVPKQSYLLKDYLMFMLKMWVASIISILFLSAVICDPVVRITKGAIQGITSKSRDGRDFYSFITIPYAKPPVDELRFEVNFIEIYIIRYNETFIIIFYD